MSAKDCCDFGTGVAFGNGCGRSVVLLEDLRQVAGVSGDPEQGADPTVAADYEVLVHREGPVLIPQRRHW